jgi:hypothetical protein
MRYRMDLTTLLDFMADIVGNDIPQREAMISPT